MLKKDLTKYVYAVRYHNLIPFINDIKGINYCIIKGAALSTLAYGFAEVRNSADVDLLINKKNLRFILESLIRNGFCYQNIEKDINREERVFLLSSTHQWKPLVKKTGFIATIVDINYDVFWGEYTGKRVDIEQFLSDTIEIEIYGVKVKTLPPLKAMVQLILHHYKEMNSIYHLTSHDSISYNMFKDVYYLWKNNKEDITFERLYSLCCEYEIISYAFYVLYFTNRIFKDKELQKYVDALRTAEGVYYLDYYGLTEKERKHWKVDFQTRLETDNLYELIKDDLTEEDIEKLERNRRIFG